MRGIQTLAAAGAAVNLGFALGPWMVNRDGPTSVGAVAAGVFVLALTVAPFVLAAVQVDRRPDEAWAERLIAAAVVIAMGIAVFAYSTAVRKVNQDGIIYVVVPAYQALLILLALATSGYLHRKTTP